MAIRLEREHFVKPPSYIIFIEDGIIKALNCLTQEIEFLGIDASEIIQKAINALSGLIPEVISLKGDFVISKAIKPKNFTILDLRGAKLKLADGANDFIIWQDGISNVVILGGEFDGNKEKQTAKGHLIVFLNSSYVSIVGTKLRNAFDRGISLDRCTYFYVADNIIENCNGEGIFAKNSCDNVFSNNHVLNNGKTGIALWKDVSSSDRNIISNNIVRGNAYNGIHLDIATSYNIVEGNVCEGNGYRGIRITPVAPDIAILNVIRGNICKGNKNDGIEVLNADYNVIANNATEDNQYHGIRLYNSDENIVCNNVVKDNSKAGAYLYDGIRIDGDSARNIICNNRVSGADQYRGIRGYDTENYNVIFDNILVGNYRALTVVGADDVVKRNLGYLTENGGVATFSGDGVVASFSWAHGLVSTPTKILVTPRSADASGDFYVTADATNITITYITAPPAGTDNIVLSWYAEV